MQFALILFTMVHLGAGYEWRKTEMATFITPELCNAVAAMKNTEIPFDRENPPYYACEAVDN